MRKVVATEYVTLDGVFDDPGGGEGTPHGGWSFQFWTEEAAKFKYDELFASDALLLGRVTYEGFAKAWPAMADTGGDFAARMNSLPKFVVSTTLKELEWNNSHLLQGNIAEEVARLKQQEGKDILLSGSGSLVRALMQHNLIDEYRLMIHPTIVGGGKRLFDGSAMKVLKLAETKSFSSGVIVLSYAPVAKEEKQ